MVRLESGCICMSVNTYLNFSATLEVSGRESFKACQRSSNHVLNQPIKIQIFNASDCANKSVSVKVLIRTINLVENKLLLMCYN